MTRLRLLLFSISVPVFTAVFTLLVIEAIFRTFGIPYDERLTPSEFPIADFNSDLGWQYKPNLTKTFDFNGEQISYHFDQNSIRVPEQGFQLDPTRPSIVFVGGSFTFGHNISFANSLPGHFSSLLPGLQVINAGVQAYGTDQSMIMLKRILRRYNVTEVVYTFWGAHLVRNQNYDRRFLYPSARMVGTKPLFKMDKNGEIYLRRKPVTYSRYWNSYFFDWIKMRMSKVKRGEGISTPEDYHLLDPQDAIGTEGIELTKALMLEMKRLSLQHSANFTVINFRWTEDGFSTVTTVTATDQSDSNFAITNASSIGDTLKVTTPNGSESWTTGKKYTIKWDKGNAGTFVKIELLKSGKAYKTIKAKTKNDGRHRWKVPSSVKIGSAYKIRVTSVSKKTVKDQSDKNFTITKAGGVTSSLKLTTPNGSESWTTGKRYTIKWDKGDGKGTVKLELLKSGKAYKTIKTRTKNDGRHRWKVPSSVKTGSAYKIKIDSFNEYQFFDKKYLNYIDTLEGSPSNWHRMRLKNDGHPNSNAYRFVAEKLYEHLARGEKAGDTSGP